MMFLMERLVGGEIEIVVPVAVILKSCFFFVVFSVNDSDAIGKNVVI